jgi:hypothetical protein
MESKRKCRWFQFSLRTLLIAVTLSAVPLGYVGWEAKVVAGRRLLLESQCSCIVGEISDEKRTIPLIRRCLGDIQCIHIVAKDEVTDAELERYRDAFPEAVVLRDEHAQMVMPPGRIYFRFEEFR